GAHLPREPDRVRPDQLVPPARRLLPLPAERHRRPLGVRRPRDAVPGPARRDRDRVRPHRQVHVPRAPVGVHGARLDGLLRRDRLMEAGAASAGGGALRWRLWALAPILLLAIVVGLFASNGSSVLDLIGKNPPPADEFDVRRIEFKPGEIRIRVTKPQPEDLTTA